MELERRRRLANPDGHVQETDPVIMLSTPKLYDRLRIEGAAGNYDLVMSIIRILIKDRREEPNSEMYAALLHSHANCQAVTAGATRKVLEDMHANGVELGSRGAQCALEALAVHPDHLLRTDILEYMKERWFSLSDRAHNFVVAGLLRERLFEQALEKLEDMIRQRIDVERWLWDKIMWMLLEYDEVDEVFYVLRLRQGVGGDRVKLTSVMWLQLLDAASKRQLVGFRSSEQSLLARC